MIFAHLKALKVHGVQDKVMSFLVDLQAMRYNGQLFESYELAVTMSSIMHHLDEKSIVDAVPLSLKVPEFDIELIQ